MLEKKTEATTTTIYGTEKNFASMKSAKDSATLIAETKKKAYWTQLCKNEV